MDKRKILMGHMALGINQDTSWIEKTQSDMAYFWIHMIEGVVLMDLILVLVLRDIIFVTAIIVIGGVTSSIFQKSSRNPRFLHLVDK